MKSSLDTLKTCRHAVEAIHSIYDQFFQHEHPEQLSINIDQHEQIKFNMDLHRTHFHQFITTQKTLVYSATLEPSLLWFNYGFSSSRYYTLVQQEHHVFTMLHNIHSTVSLF